ncbi:hypothetical protein [Methanococcus maripaludis]|uniref:Tellurite resistance protein TehA-like permease n=2 Tax=Methanococcus maripaludis TaxID=39152 RepID=A0A7J9PIH2_METMI|nr:hypothetical protein [Methanococcus maripaludis]MBA2862470.1 tellurite resistance protein TehA-like permease [Methanococcus maripaludis]
MNIESRIKRYFRKDISYMLFNVLLVMFLAFIILATLQLFVFRNPFLNELSHDIYVLLGFFMFVSIIGIAILEIIF